MLRKYPGRLFLLCLLLAALAWWGTIPYLCCTQISYPRDGDTSSYVKLPFFETSSDNTAQFNVSASLYYWPFQSGELWIRPDDCVDQIRINGHLVDDKLIKSQSYCSDANLNTRVHLDITPYLRPGQNDLGIQFSDKGGGYGLDAGISRSAGVITVTTALLAFALFLLYRLSTVSGLLLKTAALLGKRKPAAACVGFAIISLTSLYLWPILSTGLWYFSHAQDSYLYEMEQFKDSISHGILYPRWLPRLEGGYGYTTFLFVAPGLFYLTLPFSYLFSDVTHAFYVSIFLITALGLTGAYVLSRLWCGRLASVLCLTLFLMTHYVSINLFPRGDVTEFAGMMLGPWLLFFFIRLTTGIETRAVKTVDIIGLTATIFALIVMHPLVFLYSAIPGAFLLVGKFIESRHERSILILPVLCLAVAFILGSPYWYTAMQMKAYINQGGVFISDTAKDLPDLFNGYFDPGALQLVLAMLGWLTVRRSPFMLSACLAHFALLFMLTSYSDDIWHLETPLKYSQFPWRINSVLAVVQLLGMIQFMRFACARMDIHIHNASRRLVLLAVAPSLVVFFTLYSVDIKHMLVERKEPYQIWGTMDYPKHKDEWEHHEFIYAGVYKEFFPLTANYEGLPNRLLAPVPMVQDASQAGILVMNGDSTNHRIHFTANVPAGPHMPSVVINQMDFPGWKVTVNARTALYTADANFHLDQPSWYHDEHGRITVTFPEPGIYEVNAWYDGPPKWQWRNIAMIGCLALLVRALRRQTAIANEPAAPLRRPNIKTGRSEIANK